MAQELSEYRTESLELKNQDLTIRRLEDNLRALEAELEEKARLVAARF
jgi:homeobox protein cut-like